MVVQLDRRIEFNIQFEMKKSNLDGMKFKFEFQVIAFTLD
jgi:hypothetical protein